MNKATLSKQRKQLAQYKKFLPSLDLKRRQLQMEVNKQERIVADLQQREADLRTLVAERLPMLADEDVSVEDLVTVVEVRRTRETRVGLRLPAVEHIELKVRDYPLLGAPAWYDRAAELLSEAIRLRIEVLAAKAALDELKLGLKRITQRVNLFEKILIPETQESIRRIRIFLGDAEREAVVRSKIAKSRSVEDA